MRGYRPAARASLPVAGFGLEDSFEGMPGGGAAVAGTQTRRSAARFDGLGAAKVRRVDPAPGGGAVGTNLGGCGEPVTVPVGAGILTHGPESGEVAAASKYII